MSAAEWWLLLGGAAVAGFVQGLSGFAFSMVAMSLWVWGLDPKLAAVMAVFGSLVGQVIGWFSVPRALSWREMGPYLLGGAVGVPIGVALLPHLDPRTFKLALGTLLVIACPAMLFAARLPRVHIAHRGAARAADGAVGAVGGLMGGLGGFTGVAPSLWCALRGLGKAPTRSVVQNFNLAALAASMAAYALGGLLTRPMLPLLPAVAAAVLLPSLLGARLYRRLGETDYRRLVLALLTLTGVALLVTAR